jgi:hypothetical protein
VYSAYSADFTDERSVFSEVCPELVAGEKDLNVEKEYPGI